MLFHKKIEVPIKCCILQKNTIQFANLGNTNSKHDDTRCKSYSHHFDKRSTRVSFLAVESAVKQTRKFQRIIISDNSSTATFKSQNKKILKSIIDNQNGLVDIIPTPSDMPSDVHTKYIQDNYLGDSDFVTLFTTMMNCSQPMYNRH